MLKESQCYLQFVSSSKTLCLTQPNEISNGAEIFVSSPQEKEEVNITLTGPSHHRLTLAALHPLQEGEKVAWKGMIQKAPSLGNSGFQGKDRLDPTHGL